MARKENELCLNNHAQKNQRGESKTEQRAKLSTNDPPLLMNRDRSDCQVKTINCEGMEKMGAKRLKQKLATLAVTHHPIQRMFTTHRLFTTQLLPDVLGKTQR